MNFYGEEFDTLTELGNKYAIRHHEIDRPRIDNIHLVHYLFFRMLSLVDLCLNRIEEQIKTETHE